MLDVLQALYQGLKWMTLIGCSLSCVFLFLSVVTFFLVYKFLRTRVRLTLCLSVCNVTGQCMFAPRQSSQPVCSLTHAATQTIIRNTFNTHQGAHVKVILLLSKTNYSTHRHYQFNTIFMIVCYYLVYSTYRLLMFQFLCKPNAQFEKPKVVLRLG